MSRERYGRPFGGFTFLGDHADKEGFFNLSLRKQAIRLGWSNGCPRVRELSDPDHPEFGPKWIRQRYAETNFCFGVVVDMVRKLKKFELAEKLIEYRRRNPDEPVGYFEPESVPDTYSQERSPMGSLWGYVISRVMIEGFGRGNSRTSERTLKTLDILEEIIPGVNTPAELLAILSERVRRKMKVPPITILSHILPAGLLEEDNCRTDFGELARHLKDKAPSLWGIYKALEPQIKIRNGIASF